MRANVHQKKKASLSPVIEGVSRKVDGRARIGVNGTNVSTILAALVGSLQVVRRVQTYFPSLTGRQIDEALRFVRKIVMTSDERYARKKKAKRGERKRKRGAT